MSTVQLPDVGRPLAEGLNSASICAKCGNQAFVLIINATVIHKADSYGGWDALTCRRCGFAEFYASPKSVEKWEPLARDIVWRDQFFLVDADRGEGPYR